MSRTTYSLDQKSSTSVQVQFTYCLLPLLPLLPPPPPFAGGSQACFRCSRRIQSWFLFCRYCRDCRKGRNVTPYNSKAVGQIVSAAVE